MKVVIIYIWPQMSQQTYGPAVQRFVDSYMTNPPGQSDHEIKVVLNGGTGPGPYHEKMFSLLPVSWMEHSNFGKDIGAFQMAAHTVTCDLLVCFGAHIYFHRAGWLDRMVQAFLDHGPTLYGAWGYHQPKPHLRTTGFWLPPDLLKAYPYQISDGLRYNFEHGNESITLWCQSMGFDPILVSWNGEMRMNEWRHLNQQECLVRDQWSDGRGG